MWVRGVKIGVSSIAKVRGVNEFEGAFGNCYKETEGLVKSTNKLNSEATLVKGNPGFSSINK